MKINDHLNCTYQNDVSKKNLLLDLHCHLRYELIFVLNGSVIINVEGEKRKIGKNSVIAIEPLKYHTVTASEGENYERIFVEFDQTVIPAKYSLSLLKKSVHSLPRPIRKSLRLFIALKTFYQGTT